MRKKIIKKWASGTPAGGATPTSGGSGFAVNPYQAVGAAADMITNFLPEQSELSGEKGHITAALNTAYDGIADAAMGIPPVGTMIGGIMKGAGFLSKGLNALGAGTDGMTTQDAILGSPLFPLIPFGLINGIFGKRADTFTKDSETFATMGSSYTGSEDQADYASEKSGKKYGLFSSGARHEANFQIKEAKRQQGLVKDIKDETDTQNKIAISMAGNWNQAYGNKLQGGYKQGLIHAARKGMILYSYEQKQRVANIIKAAKGTKVQQDLNIYGWPNHISKDNSFIKFINTLPEEWREYDKDKELLYDIWKENGKPESYTKDQESQENAIFVTKNGEIFVNDKYDPDNDLEDMSQSFDDDIDWSEFKMNLENKLKDTKQEQEDSQDISFNQKGGQLNVIPEGALHAHKHNIETIREDLDGDITKKGIPVIAVKEDGSIEQQAEIEREEIILNLEITQQIEELRKQYHAEESPSKRDKIAEEAGRLLSNSIIEDTDDKTGLIDKVE